MFPHRVTLRRLAETTGPGGGVAEAFAAPPGDSLPCRVRFAVNREGFVASAEISISTGQIAFPTDPGVTMGDELLHGTRPLRVTGPAQARDAVGVLFVVEFTVID